MRYASRAYLLLLNGMALAAAIMLVWLMVAIVLSVVIRNLGLQPSAWFFLSTEYAMFYLTLLGAPWLVRHKGHVHIELLTSILSPMALQVVSRLVALLCVAVCVVLAWKGYDLVSMNIARNDYDVRAFFVPKWILTIAYPVCFSMMAIEFARFVVGRDILHSGEAGIKE
ncbi:MULTISPECIES: TRAP transporter small permease [unclassified Halomonas]|jgi:C4-dicarboxylate transporter DctQ subunit|uniref:TRAP transporter small permease n=1 Tax=unclassified Halomonas TaxID=2609666 RepID=UPI00028904AD|nr:MULTISPECIES: TRAP transporter small permease subunit [unclassified Halomonas]MCE8037458.1 TRAP transporter small permease [Halomonas sp. MCCC 1A11062]